ncbi:MAG: cytochrome P450 [Alphaproteobacteria bacterium]|nr:cytochrome P450 [Alphaproteobacteria bacterium]
MNKPEQLSLMNPAVQQCPFAYYRTLRHDAPVHLMPDTGMYIVTSYDLLMEVMRNPKVFSNLAPKGRRAGLYCEEAERIVSEKGYGRFIPTIVNNDPPGHTVYRGLVNDAFRAGRIRKMEAYIAEVVEDLIGKFAAKGECDAVADFAVPVPMYVIADQLGVPREHFQKFKEWSDAWVAGLGMPVPDAVLIDAAEKVVEMQHYMIARMHERRAEPRDDIMSDLVQASYDGERPLTDKEVLSIVEQILVAGNETTTNGIANGILLMAEDADLQARLRQNRDLLPKFVEEVLRTESPVQGLFRYVTEDTELGGVRLPAGATVMIRYAAGNRDDAKFEHAEAFDLDRRNNGAHIAFGSGIHHCVGSQLARAEMLASFRAFLDRFAAFELAVPAGDIHYHPSFALRGPETLPLRLTPAAVG